MDRHTTEHTTEHTNRARPLFPPEVPATSDKPEIGNLPAEGGDEEILPPLKLQDIQSL
ncbi:MAG TPA: hypothetical protein VN369_03945 [Terriglobales bacterium]|nr:hypothetical protein [Terriglobales bacterium]